MMIRSNVFVREFPQNRSLARRRKQALRLAFMERLEDRTLLSSLNVAAGTLTYDGANSVSNVTVSVIGAGTIEQFSDPGAIISLSVNAIVSGWSGSGTNTVAGPVNSFSSMVVTTSSTAGQSLSLDFSGGDPLHAAGLSYTPTAAAPGGVNGLTIQGGTFNSETYSASETGTIAFTDAAGIDAAITFSNLSLINDTNQVANFTFNAPAGAATINFVSGPAIAGSSTNQINDGGAGSFELINFANKATVTLSANATNAATNVNFSAIAPGLTLLNIETLADSNTINIVACSAPVSANMIANTIVNIGSSGGAGNMTGIQAAVSLLNGPSFYALNFHDENDTTAQTWTLNNSDTGNTSNIGLSSGSLISYRPGDINALNVSGGSGGNTFNVNQTTSGFFFPVVTTLNTGIGDDTVNVLGTGDNILNINGQDGVDQVLLGGLANIGMGRLNGTINLSNSGNTTLLSLDDSQDATGRTISISDDGTTGTLTGLCPATISYTENDMSQIVFDTGSGDDSVTIHSTSVGIGFNDAGGNNTLTLDAQGFTPTISPANPGQISIVTLNSTGQSALGNIDVQNYSTVNLTDIAPIVMTPGSTQTVTSVVQTGFNNFTVADFTLNLPVVGDNQPGLSVGGFSSTIAWSDGTSDSLGIITQDPNNANHYFVTGSHAFDTIGAFTDSNTVSFTPPPGSLYSTTLNGITIKAPLTSFSNTAGTDGIAISTTPNTSVFSPGPAAKATAGKLLKKIAIQLKTPQNKLDKLDTSTVTLSIASGPGAFANGSITTVNAIKGKATFSHLQLNTAGTYTIHILNGEKTITSQTFTVAPSKVASLTISSPPPSPDTTTALSFTVHAFDAFGNLVPKAPIKLSIASGPDKSKIIGTVSSKTAANGTATFTNLFLHTPGSYTLKAASGPFSITTSLFTVGVV